MIHYMMHDYESSPSTSDQEYKQHTPKGLIPFLEALHRQGFSYENIGNRYLRKAMVAPPPSSSSSSSSTSTTAPYDRERARLEEQRGNLQTRYNRLQEMHEYHKSKGNRQTQHVIQNLMVDNIKQQNKLLEQTLQHQQHSSTHAADIKPSTSGISSIKTTPQQRPGRQGKSVLHKQLANVKSPAAKAIIERAIAKKSSSATQLSKSADTVRQRLSSYLSEKENEDTPTTRQLKVLRPTERRIRRIEQHKLTKK